MELIEKLEDRLEPLQTLVENLPPVDQWPLYLGGILRLLKTGVGVQVDSLLHREEIAERGPEFFNGVEAGFFRQMTEYVFTKMDWDLEVEGQLPDKPGGRWIYIMNHPSLLATWPPLDLASRYLAPHTATTAKSEIIEHPVTAFLLGKPLQDMGRVGFIKRPKKPEDREASYKNLRKAVRELLRTDTGLSIFPDAHRPYPKNLKQDRKVWSEKLPEVGVDQWMTDTCFPRARGLWHTLLTAKPMNDVRYMDFTVAEPRKRHDSFHIAVQERTREEMLGREECIEHLEAWLIENWKEKNRVIREWRNGGR